jgi:hypothetical protein
MPRLRKLRFKEMQLPHAVKCCPIETISPQGWIVGLQDSADIHLLPLLLRALPC